MKGFFISKQTSSFSTVPCWRWLNDPPRLLRGIWVLFMWLLPPPPPWCELLLCTDIADISPEEALLLHMELRFAAAAICRCGGLWLDRGSPPVACVGACCEGWCCDWWYTWWCGPCADGGGCWWRWCVWPPVNPSDCWWLTTTGLFTCCFLVNSYKHKSSNYLHAYKTVKIKCSSSLSFHFS